MTDQVLGHLTSPAAQIQQAFEEISQRDMQELPFVHPHVKVKTFCFQVFEDQWVGTVLTPWMLSIMILPGPHQEWPRRKISTKLGVRFPRGDVTFIVGEIESIGQYLSCSLISPLDPHMNPTVLAQIAQNSMEELLTTPQPEPQTHKPMKRRFFLLRQES